MRNKIAVVFALSCIMLLMVACKDEVLPKPKGYLRLDYPEATYTTFKGNCAYGFEMNAKAKIDGKPDCSYTIHYPKMKATLYLTYKPVSNNLKELLRDAQKLTFEHVIKADDIVEQPYINPAEKVYGMFYQVDGNAATNSQFYLTDSTRHFVTGSLYFYAKPNFDSVMPAANYIKNDMQHLMETLQWK